jgi:arylsulfatase
VTFARRALGGAACIVHGAVIGLAVGLSKAWREVGAQGYDALGFTPSTFLVYRERAVDCALAGASVGAVAALLVLAVALSFLAFPRTRPIRETIDAALRTPAGLAWSITATLLASIAALYVVERHQHSLEMKDVAYAVGFALVCGSVLIGIAFGARRRTSLPSHALVAGLAAVAVPAFWINRSILTRPLGLEGWILNGLVVLLGLGVFAWVRRPRRHWPMTVAATVVLAIASGCFASLDRSLGEPSLSVGRPWTVVLIGVDTLRADATSLDGLSLRGRDTTPNLRKLAARGISGKYPLEHGAYSLTGTLPLHQVTLAEVLREAGYATHGVVSNMYVSRQRTFDQGFDTFDDSNTFDNRAVTSKAITDLSIRALEQSEEGKPFFLFAHYFDPHFEYMDDPQAPWAEAYRGWLREELDYFDNLLRIRHLLRQSEIDWLIDLYEEEISIVDREVGRLIEWLDRQGLAERTLIIVSADHGEEFVDHESFGHTQTLFEEQLRVPLIVVAPGGEPRPRRSKDVVETRAIFGTVLDALQIGFDPQTHAASLLAPQAPNGQRVYSVLWLSGTPQLGVRRFRLTSLREGRWKLIRDYTRDLVHLFDLEADPPEADDQAERRPEIRNRLQAELEAWTQEQRSRSGEAPTAIIDPDEAEKLKALGYM